MKNRYLHFIYCIFLFSILFLTITTFTEFAFLDERQFLLTPERNLTQQQTESSRFDNKKRGVIENELPVPQTDNKGIAEFFSRPSHRGRIPSNVLLFLSISFLLATFIALEGYKKESRLINALIKYTSRMFLVTVFYYLLKNVDSWFFQSLGKISWQPYREVALIFSQNFRSPNYYYFLKYFIDGYWLACLLFIFPCLYYRQSKSALNDDKYVSLIGGLLSLTGISKNNKIYWSEKSKLGLLTIMVKNFFIPYLVSWSINNTINQISLLSAFRWDFHYINQINSSMLCIGV